MFEVVYTVVSIQLPVIYRFLLSKEPLYVKTLNLCLIHFVQYLANKLFYTKTHCMGVLPLIYLWQFQQILQHTWQLQQHWQPRISVR